MQLGSLLNMGDWSRMLGRGVVRMMAEDEGIAANAGGQFKSSSHAMLLSHYGLHENPFGVTPDPRFLCMTSTHSEALASLVYGIQSGVGFQALISQPGMGKTTLLFNLMETYRSTAHTAFLFQTQCNSREFLEYLLSELGVDSLPVGLVAMHEKLNQLLASDFRLGKRVIVVIDEAQNLDVGVLETVRLLSDLETSRAKLMQIVLAGQQQLAEKLALPELVQLRQRISILARLDALGQEEVSAYVSHRLKVAGYRGPELFTPQAMDLLASHSHGIPRNVNTLCFNALSLAFAIEQDAITDEVMEEVIADLNPDFSGTSRSPHSGSKGRSNGNGTGHDQSRAELVPLVPTGNETLGSIMEAVREETGATGAAIALQDGSQIICRARAGDTAPELGTALDLNLGFSGQCARIGETLQCHDSWGDTRVDAEVCRQLGIRSIISIPLHREQAVIGILQVSSIRPNAFDGTDVRKLRYTADRLLELI